MGYYSLENSLLHQVLIHRCGIPITLCIIFQAVGLRAGVDVGLINMPRHFLASCKTLDSPDLLYVDCFNAAMATTTRSDEIIMTRAALSTWARERLGITIPPPQQTPLLSSSPGLGPSVEPEGRVSVVLLRMLGNMSTLLSERVHRAGGSRLSHRVDLRHGESSLALYASMAVVKEDDEKDDNDNDNDDDDNEEEHGAVNVPPMVLLQLVERFLMTGKLQHEWGLLQRMGLLRLELEHLDPMNLTVVRRPLIQVLEQVIARKKLEARVEEKTRYGCGARGGITNNATHQPPAFRVGQIMVHRLHRYRGVIYGWDESCKASRDWRVANHVARPEQPFYHVLADVRDRGVAHYVAEENIEIFTDVVVLHPDLGEYFEGLDVNKGRYILLPWWRRVYPDEWQEEEEEDGQDAKEGDGDDLWGRVARAERALTGDPLYKPAHFF